MKKTLITLAIAAITAQSANALTLVHHEETGTKLDFSGSLRLAWQSTTKSDRTDRHIRAC